MIKRLSSVAILALLAACNTTQTTSPTAGTSQEQTITFDSAEIAQNLFSWNCDTPLCPTGNAGFDTLEAAAEHWVGLMVQRDGYPDATVDFYQDGDQYVLSVSGGGVPSDYSDYLSKYFFLNGDSALQTSKTIAAAQNWNSDWTYFLTLGLALRNPYTVQVLHFPPTTVVDPDHDYLKAATTQRWSRMLELFGVTPTQADQFQSIVDVAPIAAPADAGSSLDGVIDDYSDYSKQLISIKALPPIASDPLRPIVVFGSPARLWFNSNYSLSSPLYPMTYATTSVEGQTAAVMGANHPSDIFYQEPYGGPAAMKVMQQDLVSACWQAGMGLDPSQDAASLQSSCYNDWYADNSPAKQKEICALYWQTTFPGDTPSTCSFGETVSLLTE